MFRLIANGFKGRTKSIDEKLGLQEALVLLGGFSENRDGSFYYHAGFTYINLKKITPRETVDFIKDEFREAEDTYNKIEHQVYSSKRDEKHYLALAMGRIEGKFGATRVLGIPFKTALIDFVVKKEE